MIIIPAIDLLNGKCVRLYQGDYTKVEKVASDAVDTAKYFIDQGATHLHVVDLDGAREGSHRNFSIIENLCGLDILVETGGGIRNMQRVKDCFNAGVNQVILGSAAVNDRDFLRDAIQKYKDKIIVGVDALDEKVKTAGWLNDSGLNYIDFSKTLEAMGVETLIFTDISKDGTLNGVNKKQLSALSKAVSCNIIASGGVRDIRDIDTVMELDLYGVICGKSIYSGHLSLKEAIERAKKQ